LLLLLAGFLQSEVVRAVVAVLCIGLMLRQWFVYRRTTKGGQFVFWSLIVTAFVLASVWLGLNVARYYTYDGESGRSQPYFIIVRSQDILVWIIAALIAVVFVWALVQLASRVSGR